MSVKVNRGQVMSIKVMQCQSISIKSSNFNQGLAMPINAINVNQGQAMSINV